MFHTAPWCTRRGVEVRGRGRAEGSPTRSSSGRRGCPQNRDVRRQICPVRLSRRSRLGIVQRANRFFASFFYISQIRLSACETRGRPARCTRMHIGQGIAYLPGATRACARLHLPGSARRVTGRPFWMTPSRVWRWWRWGWGAVAEAFSSGEQAV